MKISDYAKKKNWVRRIQNPSGAGEWRGSAAGKSSMIPPAGYYKVMTQEKFLDEINAPAHIIFNCSYRSNRPKYQYDEKARKNKRVGYEEVTRTAVSWQEAIRGNKAATCGANPIWIGNEGGEEQSEKVSKVKSYINTMNLDEAVLLHFYTLFGTADGALYFYRDGNDIQWRCFSFEEGDNCTITKDIDDPDEDMGVRVFMYEGYNAVELYRPKTIDFYIQVDPENFVTMFNREPDIETMTEDGYFLVSSTPHGIDESPFCYFRISDIPSGKVQNNIEDFENLLSDCGENIKYYAYQMLFLSGGAISLPNANFGGKVIGSKSENGDAKILQPADASNTLDIGFKKVYNAICDGSKSVFVKPEDLKGQNDSGAYIANLYWPEIQWAKLFYPKYHPCMTKILRVICKLVGLIEGDMLGYSRLRISYKFTPFIPKNALEETQIIQLSVEGGWMSRETAAEESDYTNPLEMERLKKEQDEKEEYEAKISERQAIGFGK